MSSLGARAHFFLWWLAIAAAGSRTRAWSANEIFWNMRFYSLFIKLLSTVKSSAIVNDLFRFFKTFLSSSSDDHRQWISRALDRDILKHDFILFLSTNSCRRLIRWWSSTIFLHNSTRKLSMDAGEIFSCINDLKDEFFWRTKSAGDDHQHLMVMTFLWRDLIVLFHIFIFFAIDFDR